MAMNFLVRLGSTEALRRLAVLVVCVAPVGCMALRLSSRGAPEEEMRTLELRFPAVDLPAAHGEDHQEPHVPTPLFTTVPVSGWLHGFDYRLVDVHGDSVPREVLHHFKVIAPERRELFSPVVLHLAGAGGETMAVSLPRQVGYPLEAGDSLLVTAMLHNPTNHSLEGVQLQITLHYSPPGSWQSPMPIVPFFTHVTAPMHEPSYDLPPGISAQSLEIKPSVSGRILGIGGHMHKYGVLLRLEDVTRGRLLWEKKAVRSPDGTVLEIPQQKYVWSSGPALRSDRTYRVTAVYDNPTGDTIPNGGMGTIGGAIVVDDPWPEVDRLAAEYIWYMKREVTPSASHRHP